MSFAAGSTANLPLPEQKPLGLDARRMATNEAARPLPVLYGRQRLSVTFVSNPYNVVTEDVKQKVGKDKRTVGHKYYCSFAALICHGPVDAIHAIYFEDEAVWTGEMKRTPETPNYVEITLDNGYGKWRLYWGTEDQPIDPELEALKDATGENVPENHPAYRGQCYFRATKHFLGVNRTNLQNIEVVVSRYPVLDSMGFGPSDIEGDCSLPVAIVEAMTNQRYGLGLAESRFDESALNDLHTSLAAQKIGLSPLINRPQPWKQVLVQMLEYVDGWHTVTPEGRFTTGAVQNAGCHDSGLPRFDETSIIDVVEIDIPDWGKTANDVRVIYTNREVEYKEDATPGNSPGNLRITEEPNPLMLERRWITRPELADRLARIAVKALSQPRITGRLSVRKSQLQGLRPGMVFFLNYARYNLCWLACRCLEVTIPHAYEPQAEIAFELDQGQLHRETYEPPQYTPPARAVATPVPIQIFKIFELPYTPALGEEAAVVPLAVRPDASTTAFNLHAERAENSYQNLRLCNRWAIRAFLHHDDLAADGTEATLQIWDADLDFPGDITEAEAEDDVWLLLIGEEVCSFYDVQDDPDGDDSLHTRRVSLKRERFGTQRASYVAATEVLVISKEALGELAVAGGRSWVEGTTVKFKLQPVKFGKALPLAEIDDDDAYPVTFQASAKRPWKPRDLSVLGSYTGSGPLTFNWVAVNREGGPFKADMNGPRTVIEIRSEDGETLHWSGDLKIDTTSVTIDMATLQERLGGTLVSFRFRVYTKQSGLASLHYEEKLVSKI